MTSIVVFVRPFPAPPWLASIVTVASFCAKAEKARNAVVKML